jgi:TRAP-type mannitol/chloroaromatic compound transport system substrate-binding protein
MLFAFVNQEKWNSLPKHYKAVLENAAAYANQWCLAKYDTANPAALRRLIAGGTKLGTFSQPIMEACYKAAMELHGEIAKENASFKKVNDSMMEFTKNAYQWFSVAELNYDVFMTNHMRG